MNVSATNDVYTYVFAGGLGGGFVGIGGAVDVGTVHNDTQAWIAGNADVRATNDVSVNALANRDVTTITIAHRLSTVRRCDRLCYLDHGKVVAQKRKRGRPPKVRPEEQEVSATEYLAA